MAFIIQKEWYTKEQIQNNRDTLFIFGDNNHRSGTGGQAKVCRNEPNCIGIVTKNRPDYNPGCYLSDDTYYKNIETIANDFAPVIKHLIDGGDVIFPADGIGTGRADLANQAPRTWEFLQAYIRYVQWIGDRYEIK